MAQPLRTTPGIAPGSHLANLIAGNPTTGNKVLGVAAATPAVVAGGAAATVGVALGAPIAILGGFFGVLGDAIRRKSTQDDDSLTQQFCRGMSTYWKFTVRAPGRVATDCVEIAKACLSGSDAELHKTAEKVSTPISNQAFSRERSISLLELENPPILDSVALKGCQKLTEYRKNNPGNYAAKVGAGIGNLGLAPVAAAETILRTAVQYAYSRQRNLAKKAGQYLFRGVYTAFEFGRIKLYEGVNRSFQAFCVSSAGSATTLISHQLETQVADAIFSGVEGRTDVLLNVLNRVSPNAILMAVQGDFHPLVTEIIYSIYEEIYEEEEEMPEEGVFEQMLRERLEIILPQILLVIHQALNRMPRNGAIIIANFLELQEDIREVFLQGMNQLFTAEAQLLNSLREGLIAFLNTFDFNDLFQTRSEFFQRQQEWQRANQDPEVFAKLTALANEELEQIPSGQISEALLTYQQYWLEALSAIADFHRLDLSVEANSRRVRDCLQASYQGMQFYTGISRDPNIGVVLSYLGKCLTLRQENRLQAIALVNGSTTLLGGYFRAWGNREIPNPAPPEHALFSRGFLSAWLKLFQLNPERATEIVRQIPSVENVLPELFLNVR